MVEIETRINVDRGGHGLVPEIATSFRAIRCCRNGTGRWISESVSHEVIVTAFYVLFVEVIHRGLIQPKYWCVFVQIPHRGCCMLSVIDSNTSQQASSIPSVNTL